LIPFDFITEWRQHAPWVTDVQVEQDLILSRALVEIFRQDEASKSLAFRGGTALYKLFLKPAPRYSEDIDLVQVEAGAIRPCLEAVRAALDPWLGGPQYRTKHNGTTLVYRVQSEGSPSLPIRLKIEINTREHFSVLGFRDMGFSINSRWFSGESSIQTYELDELMGTKLRALYQRKKGRDLFDLWIASQQESLDEDRIVECFQRYLQEAGLAVTRAEFEANLSEKLDDPRFLGDIAPLLAPHQVWEMDAAASYLRKSLLTRLPGEAWRGAASP